MQLIVCLGNPGEEYQLTRHNIGFILGKRIVNAFGFNRVGKKFKSILYSGEIAQQKTLLIFPQTYMNCSGEAVQLVQGFYKIPSENILVIYDDVDISFADLRLRKKGGAGTHNGMKSIIQCIKTQNFPRLRFGVGPKPEKWDLANFVLSNFSTEEQAKIKLLADHCNKALEIWSKGDFNQAQRALHELS